MQVNAILADATTRLCYDQALIDAQLLLRLVLNVNRAWLIAHKSNALQDSIHAVFK